MHVAWFFIGTYAEFLALILQLILCFKYLLSLCCFVLSVHYKYSYLATYMSFLCSNSYCCILLSLWEHHASHSYIAIAIMVYLLELALCLSNESIRTKIRKPLSYSYLLLHQRAMCVVVAMWETPLIPVLALILEYKIMHLQHICTL